MDTAMTSDNTGATEREIKLETASGTITVLTDDTELDVIDGYELSDTERAEFDYVDWAGVDGGTDSAEFVRYREELYDLGEFEWLSMPSMPRVFVGWDAYRPDSFFSGLLLR